MRNIAILILAAGGSTRMGSPKQLLEINGKSLIRRSAELAVQLTPEQIVVVLGNAFSEITPLIKDLPLTIVHNPDWQLGMSGSLRTGIQKLIQLEASFDAVLILLCDQPLVNQEYLERLAETYRSEAFPAVASAYNNIYGVPAIFDWPRLRQLALEDGDYGARYLLKKLAKQKQLISLDFPGGAVDLDTPEAYRDFLAEQEKDELEN